MKFNNKMKSIIFMILSSIFFTTMNFFSKLSTGITLYQKAFTANIIAVIIISFVILKTQSSFLGKKENRKHLIIRGFSGTVSLITLYYSIEHLILADSTMLSKLGPFFAAIFGYFILKDKINKKQLLFLIMTFVGALFIIKPKFSFDILPSLVGVLSAACAGIAFTMIRLIGNKESEFTIIFYNIAFATIISFPFMFFNKENYANVSSFLFMILGGLCISFGQIFLTLAFKNAPASTIAMFDYVGLLFSALYGVLFFNEIPNLFSIVGYIIILCTSLISFILTKKDSEPTAYLKK